MAKSRVQVFYRIVRGEKGHPFPGLYAVEKVFFKDGSYLKSEIVHEWDLRIISEAVLARLGGADAYESFKLENEVEELNGANTSVVEPRTAEELKSLNQKKLNKELQYKEPK
jgi:hypothetical protein